MLSFLLRRGLIGLATLFLALFIMFPMVNASADPLADLRDSTALNKEQLIQARIDQLDLDTPVMIRFFEWLAAAFQGDLGYAWRSSQEVNDLVASRMLSTLELVVAATFIALFLGLLTGIVSALRQYATFDYLMIFVSFLLYSLPAFWVAVLLKEWAAIGYNDFLRDASIPLPITLLVSVAMALLWMLALGGDLRKRLITFGVALVATAGTLVLLESSNWFNDPRIGVVGVAVIGAAFAVATVGVMLGLRSRRALYASLTTVLLGVVLYFPMQQVFSTAPFGVDQSELVATAIVIGLGVLAVLVSGLVGFGFGGPDRRSSMRISAVVGFVVASLIFLDQMLSVWAPYANFLGGRPIPTTGDRTPNLGGNYWVGVLDAYTHLVLPTVALTLIGFAAYTRYARGSLLEAMNQDYVRTARAKGLPERVVIVRHAFRNTLIPLATIVPVDIITMIGGATITETVFQRPGMGQMFTGSLQSGQVDPVMAYLLITAFLAIVANIVADIIYAAVDPRIRLEA